MRIGEDDAARVNDDPRTGNGGGDRACAARATENVDEGRSRNRVYRFERNGRVGIRILDAPRLVVGFFLYDGLLRGSFRCRFDGRCRDFFGRGRGGGWRRRSLKTYVYCGGLRRRSCDGRIYFFNDDFGRWSVEEIKKSGGDERESRKL